MYIYQNILHALYCYTEDGKNEVVVDHNEFVIYCNGGI